MAQKEPDYSRLGTLDYDISIARINYFTAVDQFDISKAQLGELWDKYSKMRFCATSPENQVRNIILMETMAAALSAAAIGNLKVPTAEINIAKGAAHATRVGTGAASVKTYEVIMVRSTLGADGSTSMIIKTVSAETGVTLKVIHRVVDKTGKVIHEDVKFVRP